MEGENQEEFSALHAQLTDEHQPATPTEQILVERMFLNQWLSLRAFRLQNMALNMSIKGGTPVNLTLPLFIRYQATADRTFDRSHNELLKAQKERKSPPMGSNRGTPQRPPGPLPKQPKISRKQLP